VVVIVFGMCMLRSGSALAEDEASPSPETPGGTLLDRTASAGGQYPYEWDYGSSETYGSVQPLNIAHRGGAKIAPENTLVGFRRGRLAGADVLELDVHLTENEKLVVIHYKRVDDTTNGTGLVRQRTLRQLKRLDAGYDFTYEHGKTHPYRG
jgi:glycerophosphoryl diester phosphodiesterase